MEKKVMLIILCILAAVLLIWLFILIIRQPNKPITFEQFKEYAENAQYEFQDNRDWIPADTVGKSCAANIKENVLIEFTECVSDRMAKQLFGSYISYVQQFKGKKSFEKNIQLPVYWEYTLESGSMYMHIARIDNTIMHVRVPLEEKQTVCTVMQELGYMKK